ncbi:MAG: hypothetical protein ACK5B9_02300 [Flavobacteriia bacterium]|jgi:hypothetical protein
MEIIPENSIKQVLDIDQDLREIFENFGVNVDEHFDATMVEISQSRLIPIKILIEDLNYVVQNKLN